MNPKGGSQCCISLAAKRRTCTCISDLCPTVLDWSAFCCMSTGAFDQAFFKSRITVLRATLFLRQIFWPEIRAHVCFCAGQKASSCGKSLMSHSEDIVFTNDTSHASGRCGTSADVLCSWYWYM